MPAGGFRARRSALTAHAQTSPSADPASPSRVTSEARPVPPDVPVAPPSKNLIVVHAVAPRHPRHRGARQQVAATVSRFRDSGHARCRHRLFVPITEFVDTSTTPYSVSEASFISSLHGRAAHIRGKSTTSIGSGAKVLFCPQRRRFTVAEAGKKHDTDRKIAGIWRMPDQGAIRGEA